MARLVAAACPKCGASVKLDPASEFVTCGYCHTSSFIETKKRPVTQQVMQAHYPVIHVKQSGAVALVVIPIILVAVLGIGGALLGVFFSVKTTMDAIPKVTFSQGRQTGATSVARSQTAQAAVKENLFADASGVYGKFSGSIGTPLKATELVLYSEYAILTAQDPKDTTHVDRYTYRYGDVSEPDPVRLSGSSKTNLEQELFDLATIDFGKVPTITTDALAAITVEEGKVTHIILEKSRGKREPVFRVYVNGPRDSGYVEYALSGKRGRVVN